MVSSTGALFFYADQLQAFLFLPRMLFPEAPLPDPTIRCNPRTDKLQEVTSQKFAGKKLIRSFSFLPMMLFPETPLPDYIVRCNTRTDGFHIVTSLNTIGRLPQNHSRVKKIPEEEQQSFSLPRQHSPTGRVQPRIYPPNWLVPGLTPERIAKKIVGEICQSYLSWWDYMLGGAINR